MGCNLSAQLASDRTATTGNHNYLTGYIPHDGIQIYFNRVSSQKVIDIDIF